MKVLWSSLKDCKGREHRAFKKDLIWRSAL